MTEQTNLGGTFRLAHNSLIVNRMGYGAMQLAGPEVWGPPHCATLVILAEMSATAETAARISPSPQLFDFIHTNMHPLW